MGARTSRRSQRLRASYAAIPPGAPVRLAKRTSNLFRPRARNAAPGLDVSGLDGVIEVDAEQRTADVQGMCTYEDLVDATLPHGLIPLVVPAAAHDHPRRRGDRARHRVDQLPQRAAARVGARDGRVHRRRRGRDAPGPGEDLFDAFPNSYGSLGYATRLRIRLERGARAASSCATSGSTTPGCWPRPWPRSSRPGSTTARGRRPRRRRVRAGGVLPDPRALVDRGHDRASARHARARPTSDYAGQQVYYRSIQQRETDLLTMYDYLWRWDTDWFWCSGAFGAQHPAVRRLWPRRCRRSDVYHRLLGLNDRTGFMDRVDRRKGRPQREQVVQDVEVPVERLEEFLEWFDAEVGMRPVWLCPLVCPGPSPARLADLPAAPRTTYVNVGFWGTVHVGPDAPDAPRNRAIEAKVHELDGHKSLYSEAFYDRETFDQLYDGDNLAAVKAATTPTTGSSPSTTRRCADDDHDRRPQKLSIAEALDSLLKEPLPVAVHGVRRQRDRPRGLAVRPPPGHRARPHLPAHRARRPRLRPGLRRRRPRAARRPPGRPLRAAQADRRATCPSAGRRRPRRSRCCAPSGLATSSRRPRRRRRRRPGCAARSRASGTRWAATPRRSTTTTTSPTASTSWSSARR